MERLTNKGTKEAKSNVTIKEVCDKLAEYENLEDLICIPLKELADIFEKHIPADCKRPQKAIVLTDDDVDEWREYKALKEKPDGYLANQCEFAGYKKGVENFAERLKMEYQTALSIPAIEKETAYYAINEVAEQLIKQVNK